MTNNQVRKRQVKCLVCGNEFLSKTEDPRCRNKSPICNSRKVVDLISIPTQSELYFVKKTINKIIDTVDDIVLDQQTLQNNMETSHDNMEYILKMVTKSDKK